MRAFAALIAALCMIGFTLPAQALGMQFCDDLKDDHARMACLQQHIIHLEQTIVVLAGRLATVENALQMTISTDTSYKLRSTDQGKCLGLGGDKRDETAVVSCDSPDSWTVMTGGADQEAGQDPRAAYRLWGCGAGASGAATPQAAAGDQPSPRGKGTNPCKGLDQAACTAKADSCAWKAEKNKCGLKDKQ